MSRPVHLWLRAESKENEHRTHLTPEKCQELLQAGFEVTVEQSSQRVFNDDEYKKINGINIVPEGSWTGAPKDAYILGIKELPKSDEPITQKHIYFAHAYKNQSGWCNLLQRFDKGGGCVLDVEYITDDQGRRTVAVFPHIAGFTGMAIGILAWCHKMLNSKDPMPSVKPFTSKEDLMKHVRNQLRKVGEEEGISHFSPRIVIIGALGRCGKGSLDLARKVGIPDANLAKWDMDETKDGGPFHQLLDFDVFVNCICLTEKIPPFLTRDMLDTNKRTLSVVVDVSCDVLSPYNPLPIYDTCTSFQQPSRPVQLEHSTKPLEIVAVDCLPSLLPCESSKSFSEAMMPYLLQLPKIESCSSLVRALKLFEEKSSEAKNTLAMAAQ